MHHGIRGRRKLDHHRAEPVAGSAEEPMKHAHALSPFPPLPKPPPLVIWNTQSTRTSTTAVLSRIRSTIHGARGGEGVVKRSEEPGAQSTRKRLIRSQPFKMLPPRERERERGAPEPRGETERDRPTRCESPAEGKWEKGWGGKHRGENGETIVNSGCM